jgi:hypothetical protein
VNFKMYSRSAKGGEKGDPNRNPWPSEDGKTYVRREKVSKPWIQTLTKISIFVNSRKLMESRCLTPLSTIFQLYRDRQFYLCRKPEYPEKTTDRPAPSHWKTLSHNIVSSTPRLSDIRTHNVRTEVIGTACIGSYTSNYHTITTTTLQSKINETTVSHERGKDGIWFYWTKTNGTHPLLSVTNGTHPRLYVTQIFP